MIRFLTSLLVAVCLAPAATAQGHRDATSEVRVFDEAWGLSRDHFFDSAMAGVDWKAARERHLDAVAAGRIELSQAINAMLAELGTSHTGHYTPDDVEFYHLRDIFRAMLPDDARKKHIGYEGIEAWLEPAEREMLITGVWPGGNAERAGLLTGDVIVAVDGDRPTPVAAFRGRAGNDVELTILRTAEGEPEARTLHVRWIHPTAALLDAMSSSVRILEHNGQRVGYIHILSYAAEAYHKLLLDEIFKGRLKDADALLIDIRGGWGGAQPRYLDPFLRGPVLTMHSRDGESFSLPQRWQKPVGMLIDGGSRSGKEVLAHGFRRYGLGPLIGERTGGAVVAGQLFTLSDGSILYLAVADVTVDGERLEGVGVDPHIHVPFPRRFAAGADPQLDAAVRHMAELAASSE